MQDAIACVTQQVRTASKFAAMITTSFLGLHLIERATRALAEYSPEESYPAYVAAEAGAADALEALSNAPSLVRPEDSLDESSAHEEFADAASVLVLSIAQTLVRAADRTTDAADRTACLEAVMHAGRIHAALK